MGSFLALYGAWLSLDEVRCVLKHFLADKDFTRGSGGAVAAGAIHDLSDYGELHAFTRADEAVHHGAAMNTNAEVAKRIAAMLKVLVQLHYRIAHLEGGMKRVFVLGSLGVRSSKDSQNGIAHEFFEWRRYEQK